MERLGLGVVPVAAAGWTVGDAREVAREAEAAGFDAVLVTEVNNDSLATAAVMGAATSRITVGTWVANIYLRHPYACAHHAATVAAATEGRFVLGLGVSHQPVNGALQVDMGAPAQAVAAYAAAVQAHLRGEGPATHLPQSPAPVPVPVYLAALTSTTVAAAAEVADGLMPLFWSAERVAKSKAWIDRGRAAAPGRPPIDLTLGLPTFVGPDLAAQYDAARANLALFTTFPFFQRLFHLSGFEDEAAQMVAGAGGAALSDRLLDAVGLFGPIERCREQLAAFRAAGVDLPILWPALGVAPAMEVLRLFSD